MMDELIKEIKEVKRTMELEFEDKLNNFQRLYGVDVKSIILNHQGNGENDHIEVCLDVRL